MFKLNQLLKNFKNLTNSSKVKKQLIVEIFERNKIPININQISISNETLFIKTQPIIKTEIMLKKEMFLNEIKKVDNLIYISDIK